MAIYFGLLALITAPAMLFDLRNNKTKKRYVFFSFAAIALIIGLRSRYIGTDTASYYYQYFAVANASWENLKYFDREMGYIYFVKCLNYITPNPQILFLVSGIFTCYCVGVFLYKNSEDVVMSTYLFVTFSYLGIYINASRQALAIAFVLLGLEALKKNHFIKFLAIVIIASFFHRSVLVVAVYVILKNFRLNVKLLILSVIAFLFAYSYTVEIIAFFDRFIGYYGYLFTQFGESKPFQIQNIIMLLIQTMIILLLILTRKKIEPEKIKYIDFMLVSLLISLGFYILSYKIYIIDRLSAYFDFFYILAIPVIIKYTKDTKTRMLLTALIYFLFLAYFTFVSVTRNYNEIVPYRFYWQDV